MIKRITEFHASIINNYTAGCALATKFEYIDGRSASKRPPYLVFGTGMHLAIEELHNNDDLWEESKLKSLVKDSLRRSEFETRDHLRPVSRPDDSESRLRLKDLFVSTGTTMLKHYISDHNNINANVIMSELSFKVNIGKYLFAGTIDQVRKNSDGSIELVDFKTSKKMPSIHSLMRSYQFAVYMLALRDGTFSDGKKYGITPDIITWYHLRDYQEYEKPTPVESIEKRGNNITDSFKDWLNNKAKTYSLEEIKQLTGNNRYRSKDKIYCNIGHCKGPGRHSFRWSDHWLSVMEKNIIHVCAAMRMDKYPPNPSYCSTCRFIDRCDLHLHGFDNKFLEEQQFLPKEMFV